MEYVRQKLTNSGVFTTINMSNLRHIDAVNHRDILEASKRHIYDARCRCTRPFCIQTDGRETYPRWHYIRTSAPTPTLRSAHLACLASYITEEPRIDNDNEEIAQEEFETRCSDTVRSVFDIIDDAFNL